jgi:hypothetical protein
MAVEGHRYPPHRGPRLAAHSIWLAASFCARRTTRRSRERGFEKPPVASQHHCHWPLQIRLSGHAGLERLEEPSGEEPNVALTVPDSLSDICRRALSVIWSPTGIGSTAVREAAVGEPSTARTRCASPSRSVNWRVPEVRWKTVLPGCVCGATLAPGGMVTRNSARACPGASSEGARPRISVVTPVLPQAVCSGVHCRRCKPRRRLW